MQPFSQRYWCACQLLAIAGVSLALAGTALALGGGGAGGAAGGAAGAAGGAAGAAAGAASGGAGAAGNAAGGLGSTAGGALGGASSAASSATGTLGGALGNVGNLGPTLGLGSLGVGPMSGAKPGSKAHKAYRKKILAVFEAQDGDEKVRIKRQCVDVLRYPSEYDLSLVDLCRVLRLSQRR